MYTVTNDVSRWTEIEVQDILENLTVTSLTPIQQVELATYTHGMNGEDLFLHVHDRQFQGAVHMHILDIPMSAAEGLEKKLILIEEDLVHSNTNPMIVIAPNMEILSEDSDVVLVDSGTDSNFESDFLESDSNTEDETSITNYRGP